MFFANLIIVFQLRFFTRRRRISHLRSKYFTAKRFHLPERANFVAYLLYGRYSEIGFFEGL